MGIHGHAFTGSRCKTKGTSYDTTSTEYFNYFSQNGEDSAEITEVFFLCQREPFNKVIAVQLPVS